MRSTEKIYRTFDDAVISGVNATVRAWNWTTSKTRAELASLVAYSAPLLTTSHGIISTDPNSKITPIIFSTIGLAAAYVLSDTYKRQEKLEFEALKKNAKDLEATTLNNSYASLAPILSAAGILSFILGYTQQGFLALPLGLSLYLNRADPQAPRKSTARRGLEKLAEVLNERKVQDSSPIPL